MNSTSTLYKSIYSGIHLFEVKVNISGTDYGMDVLTSLSSRRSAFGTGSPHLGLAPSGELALSLYVESGAVPRMATIRPYFRVVNDIRQSEWIAKGVYFVDTREADTTTGLLTLRAYDAMLKGEVKYPSTSHTWPYSDINTVREIASFLGVAVDAQTTSLMTGGYMIPLPAQYTVRETLRYIAALYGGSFVVTDANTLRLIPLWSVKTAEDAPLGGTHRLTAATAFPACTGVRFLLDNDQELFAGDETGYVYEISCPFATQAAANALLTKLRGFVYRPFSAEAAVVNPACELGDTLSVPDGLGGTFLTGLFSSDLVFDSLCAASVSAPEDEELDHEYPYIPASERSFSRKIQNVQSELTLQAQQIAAKVSRTGGDASSFGWYLDADKFQLLSNNTVVMLVNRDGCSVQGVINATAGNIGGCSISDGVLRIANANIDSLNANKSTAGTLNVDRIATKSLQGSKIADYTLTSTKIDDGAAVNRVIGSSAVSYGKTSFTGTLDQVGTNKANIDTINGYFTGSANFNALSALSFALNYHYLALETITIGGVNRKVVTWT